MDNDLLSAIDQLLDKKLEPIHKRLGTLEAGQSKLEAGQAKLEAGQAKLEADLEFTKNTVIRMEVEHGRKLEALFDGLDRHEAAIIRLESKVDRIEAKVDALDTTVGIHDMMLNKLAK